MTRPRKKPLPADRQYPPSPPQQQFPPSPPPQQFRPCPLRFTHLHLENWRNFTRVDVDLERRVFLVGPNASGKSNLLDAFRFLHDITSVGGGFQAAVTRPWRGNFTKLKSLTARHHANIAIRVRVGDDKAPELWEYELRFAEDQGLPRIKRERVVKQGKELLNRPTRDDEKDPQRLAQTNLEQMSVNEPFRELAEFFAAISYVHLVPQVIRNLLFGVPADDPFGGSLLRRMAELPEDVREQRLSVLRTALRAAVPQLRDLQFWPEPYNNKPHLRAAYEHLPDTWQLEDQFSDGTLRLIGMLWSLLDGTGPVLLEEPELWLHPGVVRYLAGMFARLDGQERRQVIISTHSPDLLRDEGIGLNEVLLLQPGPEGTNVSPATQVGQIQTLVEAGMNLEEAVLPHTNPPEAQRLALTGS